LIDYLGRTRGCWSCFWRYRLLYRGWSWDW